MQETFLYYIWQFQYYDRKDLVTSENERVEVIKQGFLHNHSGPDFENAKVRINGIDWAGSVEIHIKSSEWFDHRHHLDPAYDQVVLHVVWQHDKPVKRSDGTWLPTLELQSRVNKTLIDDYKRLVNNPSSIPCKKSFANVDTVIKLSMLDKVMTQRLESKASQVTDLLVKNNNDWRETSYQVLARNFGFKINSEPLVKLSMALPYKILLKHADQPLQVEALLFGQAGLLDLPVGDEYYKLLQREYFLLNKKYALTPRRLSKVQWRFLRLRPANFPTIRIAQFAALVTREKELFSKIFEITDLHSFRKLFLGPQSGYWTTHYQFNRTTKQPVAGLGESSVDNLIVNSVVPLLVAYGKHIDQQQTIDRAVQILQQVPAEINSITKIWSELDFNATTAFDSQALIELYNHYCQQRNCLNCAIGSELLKPKT